MSKLLYIKQLELLLLATRHTLRNENIELSPEIDDFVDTVTYANDLDVTDLLDTLEILKEEIEKQAPDYLEIEEENEQ